MWMASIKDYFLCWSVNLLSEKHPRLLSSPSENKCPPQAIMFCTWSVSRNPKHPLWWMLSLSTCAAKSLKLCVTYLYVMMRMMSPTSVLHCWFEGSIVRLFVLVSDHYIRKVLKIAKAFTLPKSTRRYHGLVKHWPCCRMHCGVSYVFLTSAQIPVKCSKEHILCTLALFCISTLVPSNCTGYLQNCYLF